MKAAVGKAAERLPEAKAAAPDWPEVSTAEVYIPASGSARRAGHSPVLVRAVTGRAKAGLVQVSILSQQTVRRLGGFGLAFTLERVTDVAMEPADAAAPVPVTLDVGGFAGAFGADLTSRLRLLRRPACAATTPRAQGCSATQIVPATVDAAHGTITAQVTPGEQQLFVLASVTDGQTGDYSASPLKSSSRWAVGEQSGGFSWSYPVPEVPSPGGSGPGLELSYSSQSVDGLVASENTQPSWAGLGWDLAVPFIERRYTACAEDGGSGGDLCWAGEVLELSLKGSANRLVRDTSETGDVWRPKDDPGWRVERLRGAVNGDDDGEYWQVRTPDGFLYTFGRGRQSATGRATDSTLTVPVYGNDPGEPCRAQTWCQQAWRWNLDSVTDPHGNVQTWFHAKETNNYLRGGTTTAAYDRSSHLLDVEYGQRAGAEDVHATSRVHLTTVNRCLGAGDGGTACAPPTSTSTDYPDVPVDQICTAACTAEQTSPTFFSTVLLRSTTSQYWNGIAWADVDRLTLTHRFPQPTDTTSPYLWLDGIRRTGLTGSAVSLPEIRIAGTELPNRADPADTEAELRKLRVTSVTDELGRRVDVRYGQPDPCTPVPADRPDDNVQDCFPAWRVDEDEGGFFGWWHKYVVSDVTVNDVAGGSPPQVTSYRYVGTPAWHYDDTPATPRRKQSWGDWRGYAQVDVALMSASSASPGAARPLSLTRTRYFRGMDGDRRAGDPFIGRGSRGFSVTDSTGMSVPDSPWLAGRMRETQQFALNAAGEPAYELGGELNEYASARTTRADAGTSDPWHDAHLVVPTVRAQRETVIAEPGGGRSTRAVTEAVTFDAYGQRLTSTQTLAGAGVTGPQTRCIRWSYARDAGTVSAYLLSRPFRERRYAGSCAAPAAVLRSTDTYFDGSATLGAQVSRGDVTREDKAVAASGPDTVGRSVSSRATFDGYGRVLASVDGNGNTTRTAYTPATGLPQTQTVTNPLGQVTTTQLTPDRQSASATTDANGRTTRLGYDALGRLISVRQPDQAADAPPAFAFAYFLDPDGQAAPKVTSRRLQVGATYIDTFQFLDSLGRIRQKQTVSPVSAAGSPQTVITDTRYDERGLKAAESMPAVAPGAAGTALVDISPSSVNENRFSYDELGRETRTGLFSSGTFKWATTTAYFGDHSRMTPPPGGSPQTTYTDALGRKVRVDQGSGQLTATTTYGYDLADQVVTVTDPGGHATTAVYDLLGRRTSGADPDAGATATTYDDAGNPATTTDAAGVTLTTTYDAVNRPTAVWRGAAASGTRLDSWAYDSTSVPNGIGRLASQTAYAEGKAFTQSVTSYDVRGRVTGRAWNFPAGLGLRLTPATYQVKYAYDSADHITSVSYPDAVLGNPAETITNGFNAVGMATTVTATQSGVLGSTTVPLVTATQYAADGKLIGRSYANPLHSLARSYSYDADTQRLSGVTTSVGGLNGSQEAQQQDTYTWDPSGNLTSVVDQATNLLKPSPIATCYTYDGLNRVTHAWTTKATDCSDSTSTLTHDGPAGMNSSWTYSADGNITSARSLLVDRSFRYNDPKHPHAVTSAGADGFAYDANGQQTGRLKTLVPGVVNWTPQHQVESVLNGKTLTRFVYGADGSRLVRFNTDGSAVLYIDGQEILVVAGIATGTRFYRQGKTAIAQRLPTGVLVWQLNDTQGSAQVSVVSGTSVLVRTYYDPYGKIRLGSGPTSTDHGFLGKVADPLTGLDALDARQYDPDLGRFVSTDPLNVQVSAQSANPYSYAANNPVAFSDPTGLDPWYCEGRGDACYQNHAGGGMGAAGTSPGQGVYYPNDTPIVTPWQDAEDDRPWNVNHHWYDAPKDRALLAQLVVLVDVLYYGYGYKDAAVLLKHWMENSGTPVQISPSRLMGDVPGVEANITNEIIQGLKNGAGTFDSGWKKATVAASFSEGTDKAALNWYYALNGYQYRVRGYLVREHGETRQMITIDVFKRYNWGNPAGGSPRNDLKKGPVTISQNRMAELHEHGRAQDFNVWGTETYSVPL